MYATIYALFFTMAAIHPSVITATHVYARFAVAESRGS